MSLMGTLAKVAIGYAAARGVDRMAKGQGLGSMFGGTSVKPEDAQAEPTPGMEQMQGIMAQMAGQMAGLQDTMTKMAAQSGFDMSAIMPGGAQTTASGAGAGIAGILAAMGRAATTTGQGIGSALDQFKTNEAAPEADAAAGLLLRAMIMAARADGQVDDDEKAKIMDSLGEDSAPEDIAFVQAAWSAPVDIAQLAADTPAGMQMQVYAMSLMTIRPDTPAEAGYLDELAQTLGLNQQVVNALHMQMGVAPLYS